MHALITRHAAKIIGVLKGFDRLLFRGHLSRLNFAEGVEAFLRRQGVLEGIWCLDPNETLGPGQQQEIDRVYAGYPHLNDDAFVRTNLHRWLS